MFSNSFLGNQYSLYRRKCDTASNGLILRIDVYYHYGSNLSIVVGYGYQVLACGRGTQ